MPVRPGTVSVPEPAIGAVRQALVWVLERSVSQRLVALARSAAGAGEEGQDALYAAACRPVLRDGRPELDIWPNTVAVGDRLPTLPL